MKKPPNILVIMSDQHASDHIASFGHPAVITPNLDRLHARGMAFDNFYCNYPMCTPARASFMTGQLTPKHGVWELGSPLASDIPTWVHVLRYAGYTTSISGRMHFIGPDKMHGFERRVYDDIDPMATPFSYADWSRAQERELVMCRNVKNAMPVIGGTEKEHYDKRVIDAAIDELDHFKTHSQDQPWLLTVGLFLPHFPYQVDEHYYRMYDDVDIPAPRTHPNNKTFAQCVPAQLANLRKWLGITEDMELDDMVFEARRCYYALITQMDEQIGRLLNHLNQLDMDRDTLIVYLSDHGDSMGEHGFWSKMNFYEDSVRIPLIIAPPNHDRPGETCSALTSQVDWMSTVLELVGMQDDFPFSLPGRSLLPLLENPQSDSDDAHVIADYACEGTRTPMRMVRRGNMKACFARGFDPMLFDLSNDPHEWHDLGKSPDHKQELDSLWDLCSLDGWKPESLENELLQKQKELRFIHQSERGSPCPF